MWEDSPFFSFFHRPGKTKFEMEDINGKGVLLFVIITSVFHFAKLVLSLGKSAVASMFPGHHVFRENKDQLMQFNDSHHNQNHEQLFTKIDPLGRFYGLAICMIFVYRNVLMMF